MKPVVIILLASKSSGSSAFQKYLQINYGVNLLPKTPHHENETLYWTKAASVLDLKQDSMHRSEVPISREKAKAQLVSMLQDNDIAFEFKAWSENELFEAFYEIIKKNGPVFFEKSPHHLFNFSNIELILRFKEQYKHLIDLHLVGLIRNPLETIFSAWSRWRFNCRSFEFEWRKSYLNLDKLKSNNKLMHIYQYEDLTINSSSLDQYLVSLGLNRLTDAYKFHNGSVSRVKQYSSFCHQLSMNTIVLAKRFGYLSEVLKSKSLPDILWYSKEMITALKYSIRTLLR